MKQFPLTRGRCALVDDEDFERLMEFDKRWQASPRRLRDGRVVWYAKTDVARKGVYMHRWIMNPPNGLEVDHLDGDGLNNRRNNLEIVTRKKNAQNLHVVHGAVPFRGVAYVVGNTSFRAYGFQYDEDGKEKQIQYGCFKTAEAAAVMRDARERERGRTRGLNFEPGAEPMTIAQALAQKIEKPKSRSGIPGIRPKDGKFEVWTRRDNKKIYLGRCETLRQARMLQLQSE